MQIRDGGFRVMFMNDTNNTKTATLTADTITTAEIRALRREAEEHGDRDMVLVCDLAIAAHETADSQGGDLIGPDGAIWTRTQARAACADAINDARTAG